MKTRIITAVVLVLIVAAVLFLTYAPLTVAFWTMVAAVLGYEWGAFLLPNAFDDVANVPSKLQKLYAIVCAVVCLALLYVLMVIPLDFMFMMTIITLIGLFWCTLAPWYVLKYPKQKMPKVFLYPLGVLLCAFIPAILAYFTHFNALIVPFLFLITIFADSGAYFIGRRFGKTPLLANVSPNKTLEGFFGGLLCAFIGCTIFSIWTHASPLVLGMLGVFLSLFSVLGDLFESMLKRQSGIKDSGHILPGHGGVLDRLDSMLAVAPMAVIMVAGLSMLGLWRF